MIEERHGAKAQVMLLVIPTRAFAGWQQLVLNAISPLPKHHAQDARYLDSKVLLEKNGACTTDSLSVNTFAQGVFTLYLLFLFLEWR